ncbi:MAG: RIP metalloprotease RseP [Candidatus Pacebacteria bacterium]|nr:RIP metalloprotease RseP [Candidatus Paceibacterota bacterium]
MSILIFIIILAVLVFVHELGHFLVAKRAGVRVDEFGIGFPPALWKKKVGETMYSINAFPIGGFVKIFGENPDEESLNGVDASRSLTSKSKIVQASVIVAGIVFNLVFAWFLVSSAYMIGVHASTDSEYGARVASPALTIIDILPKSPAELAGLKIGDKILNLKSGKDVLENPNASSAQDFVASHKEVVLTYERGGIYSSVVVNPKEGIATGRLAIGIAMDVVGNLQLPFYEAPYAGLKTTVSLTWDTATGLFDFFKQIFIGKANFSQVSGPVGIVGVVGSSTELGFVTLLTLAALISINLAVINILPFPALDGGRLFFILVEKIKGSPIKPTVANAVNLAGFALLIILMIVVTYHDIAKIIYG